MALLFLDLNGFKAVNDTYGHDAGDAVLVEAASRIAGATRGGDTVARLGGDEFVVLCEGVDADAVDRIAQRIEAAFAPPFAIGEATVQLSASLGRATAGAGATSSGLLREADAAMYRAKRAGR
ncbi:GGDEF domain-containing protein [Naasia aerilata]|uniref:GGDEF domain-containing protein n=1 Tax=Naasia aerilata TaxID=1162966 RepID=UPI0033058AD7